MVKRGKEERKKMESKKTTGKERERRRGDFGMQDKESNGENEGMKMMGAIRTIKMIGKEDDTRKE